MHTIAFNYDTVFLFRSFWGNNMSTEYNPKTARPRLKTSAGKSGYSNPGGDFCLWVEDVGTALLSPVGGTQ